MSELFDPLNGGERLAVLVMSMLVTAGMVIPIVTVGLCQWRIVREREAATALVHDMLARGMSTEEIERVLAAAGISEKSRPRGSHPVGNVFVTAAGSGGRPPTYDAQATETHV